ncbi:MAG: DUF2288 domain-containing protein [Gammaproteobacteria bacterium]|nr:DUF2288 domain-containing protein [Gammaproteobacteria bacterium]
MSDTTEFSDEDVLRAKLNTETAVVEWPELERHFARGVVIRVSQSLSLLDAAVRMSQDAKDEVVAWLNSGELAPASDDDARDWQARRPLLWCVVTAPWVLVQEKPGTSAGEQIH